MTYPREDPVSQLDDKIRRLRRRYAGRRMLDILAVAVTMDISLDLFAYLTFSLFQWSFHVPFFLEIFLAVLIIRETGRLKKSRFTQLLDSRFNLQDRLYSFLWYSGAASVPNAVREAQARECLKSVDFASLNRKLKPRVPPVLFVTLPFFLGLTWWYLNVDYRPPGTVTTTILKIVTPDTDHTNTISRENARSEGDTGQDDKRPQSAQNGESPEGSEKKLLSAETVPEGEDMETADPTASPEEGAASANRQGGPELERREAGEGGTAPGDDEASPEGPIQSNPVTDEVSEVAQARLRSEPSLGTPSVQEPDHLISLLPWSLKGSSSEDQVYVPDIPGYDINQYPVQYRSHLTRYQKELQTWAATR